MFKKDYLLNEIEKLSLIIAKLMGLKEAGKTDEFILLADTTCLNEYNIHLGELLELSPEDFKLLLAGLNCSADKLDALGQLLYLYCQPFSINPETFSTLQKVIVIFDLLETKYHWQSFENIKKRNFIDQFINRDYE